MTVLRKNLLTIMMCMVSLLATAQVNYGKLVPLHVDGNQFKDPSGNTVGFDYTNLIPATVDRVPTVYVENGLVQGLDPNDPIEVDYENNFPGEPTALTNPEMLKMRWHHGHQGTIVNGVPRIGFMKGGKKARWNDETMADYFLGKVKSFMTNHQDEPFFLYYGLHEPHVPRVPNERFAGASGLGPRGDAIIEADWCVGQAIACLDSLGILDNTIVIFTADNGAVLQDGYQDLALESYGTLTGMAFPFLFCAVHPSWHSDSFQNRFQRWARMPRSTSETSGVTALKKQRISKSKVR